jgi:hypothetical protein
MANHSRTSELVLCPACKARVARRKLRHHLAARCLERKSQRDLDIERALWVQRKQEEGAAQGRRWITLACRGCGLDVRVHVDWEKPLVLCKVCGGKRRKALFAKQAAGNAAKALQSSMSSLGLRTPKGLRGHPVSGGLPSLGRRR